MQVQSKNISDPCPQCKKPFAECACTAAPTLTKDPLCGQILNGQYELLSLIAHGGMGSVYRARHSVLKADRAVKLIRAESTNETRIKRLEQEAKAVFRLTHANIVACHDFGVSVDGSPYLVMELVDGRTLSEVVQDEPFSIQRMTKIFLQVVEALEYAHRAGMIHRDIKPSNIMLMRDTAGGEVAKVLDFGIAKIRSGDMTEQKLTSTGEIFGSPLYMSPEQGQGLVVDGRADIYSLGCVMYETLTGKPPFVGDTPIETIMKHMTKAPERIAYRESFGSKREFLAIEAVIFACLAKNPADRYGSMTELKNDLCKVQSGQTLVSARIRKAHGDLKTWYRISIGVGVICYMGYQAYDHFLGKGSWANQVRLGSESYFHPERAGGHFNSALKLIPDSQVANRNKAFVEVAWGRMCMTSGKNDEAELHFRKAIKYLESYRKPGRKGNDWRGVESDALEGLAQTFIKRNDPHKAITLVQEAMVNRKFLLESGWITNRGENLAALISCYEMVGDSLLMMGEPAGALENYIEAEKRVKEMDNAQLPLAAVLLKEARAMEHLGKNEADLVAILQRALEIKKTVLGDQSEELEPIQKWIDRVEERAPK